MLTMPIDYSRLRNLTAREIVRALERDGFKFRRQKGSHRRYVHPDGRKATVPFHRPSGTFPLKTLASILEEQARWTEEDLARLNLF